MVKRLDKDDFTRLVLQNQTAMFRTARAIVSTDEDAEDAVQSAICTAFTKLDALRDPAKFKSWILRIVVNNCYDLCRKYRPITDLSEVQDFLPADDPDPTERLSLWEAVLSLNPEMRSVVTLFYYDGFSIREISRVLGISDVAVKTRLSRSRKQLRLSMDQFDELLRQRAAEESFPLPEDYAGRVFQTCAALDENSRRRQRRHWETWAAAALALFITIPNVSPSAAAAMAEIPGLGALVKVVTFRSYAYNDGHSSMDISVPELSGSDAADTVNQEVRAYTDELLTQFYKDCERIGNGYQDLRVSSVVLTNTDTWFTLRIDATQTEASSYAFSRFYHIDKATGQMISLRDLFRDGTDYVSVLSNEVLRQVEAQMSANQALAYFPEDFAGIDAEQNFYLDANGNLVLVFDEFAIAAGSMGMPEFTIEKNIYQDLLKEAYQKGFV